MTAEDAFIAASIAFIFVAAGFVKGVVGLGLPRVAMGALSLIMPPVAAAAMLLIPSFVTNVWQLVTGPAFGTLVRRFGTMMLAICAGTALTIGVLTGQSTSLASAALGAALTLYGAVALAAPRFAVPRRRERWLSPLIGVLTGLVTGATGVFVIPAVPYLGSLDLTKEELVQALGLSFTVSTVALGVVLALNRQFQFAAAGSSLLAVVPALLGMFIGQRVRNELRPEIFRKWFFVGLIVLGAYMIIRGLVR